jgi:Carbohydrate binding domain/Glycosyl hydrolase family 26
MLGYSSPPCIMFVYTLRPIVFAGLLASFTLASAQYVPRENYGARLEPVGRILHGAGQDGKQDDNDQDQKLNGYLSSAMANTRRPAIYMVYLSTADASFGAGSYYREYITDMQNWEAAYTNIDFTPQLGYNIGGYVTAIKNNDTAEIATREANVDALVTALGASGRPWFVRIGYEFNGSWNGYDKAAYKTAYQRIAAKLRTASVVIANVWTYSAEGSSAYMDWYPGDAHVDWWGIDFFDISGITESTTNAFLNDAHARYKPVMIGECTPKSIGVGGGQDDWDAWFAPLFNRIRNSKGIKALCYINWNWTITQQWPTWGDCRIEQNATVKTNWNSELSNGIYLHADFSPPSSQRLANGRFDADVSSWSANSPATLASVTSPVRHGARAVRLQNRTASSQGVQQNILADLNALGTGEYYMEAWVRAATGTPTARLLLLRKQNGTWNTLGSVSATVNSTGWTKLSATVNAQWSGSLQDAVFKIDTTSGTANLIVDDCLLVSTH